MTSGSRRGDCPAASETRERYIEHNRQNRKAQEEPSRRHGTVGGEKSLPQAQHDNYAQRYEQRGEDRHRHNRHAPLGGFCRLRAPPRQSKVSTR